MLDMLSLPLYHIVLGFVCIHCIFRPSLPTWSDCIKARCLKFNDGIFVCIWKFAQRRTVLLRYLLSAVTQKARLNPAAAQSPDQEAQKTEGKAVKCRAAWLPIMCYTQAKPRSVSADGCCLLPLLGWSHYVSFLHFFFSFFFNRKPVWADSAVVAYPWRCASPREQENIPTAVGFRKILGTLITFAAWQCQIALWVAAAGNTLSWAVSSKCLRKATSFEFTSERRWKT